MMLIEPSNLAPSLGQLPAWLLLAGGAALGWAWNFWTWLRGNTIGQIAQRVSVSVSVEEQDHAEAFLWLSHWAEVRLRQRRIARLLLRRKLVRGGLDPLADGESGVGQEYELIPSYGTYTFLWQGCLLFFTSGEKDAAPASDSSMHTLSFARRRVAVSIWGTRDRSLLLDLIAEARSAWQAANPSAQHYYSHRYGYWNSKPLGRRRADSVYLPDGMLAEILADAREFLSSRETFESLGVPWRRGYLLYGPPGTGKTTIVHSLATELGMPLYFLSLSAIRSREDLANLLDSVCSGSILLIEDVDCIAAAAARMNEAPSDQEAAAKGQSVAVSPQTTRTDTSAENISPSDLLNQIDGIVASEGRILIMTTNYPEKLDAALVRPGRVDRKWEIGYALPAELLRFRERAERAGMAVPDCDSYLRALGERPTIAAAQALLLRRDSSARPPIEGGIYGEPARDH